MSSPELHGDGVAVHTLTEFCAPPFDIVEDLCGDPQADLVVLLAGNQFMVMPDLIAGFLSSSPSVRSVFYETLPPGIVLDQLHRGGLRIGTLELRIAPDVVALSPERIEELYRTGLTGRGSIYASNQLAVIVPAGNPAQVTGLVDLGRRDVRVAIPDPATEGIGRLALAALELAGGAELRHTVEVDKLAGGTTVFTTIHHRQSPAWVEAGEIDAAVVWSTEAIFHLGRGAELESIPIPTEHNQTGGYAAALVTAAPHPNAAASFLDYLGSDAGRSIYRRHGFGEPLAR